MPGRRGSPDEQPQNAELEFVVVEGGEQLTAIEVWAVGDGRRVSLGMWTLYWDGSRWLIEKPGIFALLGKEPSSQQPEEGPQDGGSSLRGGNRTAAAPLLAARLWIVPGGRKK